MDVPISRTTDNTELTESGELGSVPLKAAIRV